MSLFASGYKENILVNHLEGIHAMQLLFSTTQLVEREPDFIPSSVTIKPLSIKFSG
jgi:hypothetical protein